MTKTVAAAGAIVAALPSLARATFAKNAKVQFEIFEDKNSETFKLRARQIGSKGQPRILAEALDAETVDTYLGTILDKIKETKGTPDMITREDVLRNKDMFKRVDLKPKAPRTGGRGRAKEFDVMLGAFAVTEEMKNRLDLFRGKDTDNEVTRAEVIRDALEDFLKDVVLPEPEENDETVTDETDTSETVSETSETVTDENSEEDKAA